MMSPDQPEITVERDSDGVATITRSQPPNNYASRHALRTLADAMLELDDDTRCRVIVLRAEGKHFCAGVDFATEPDGDADESPGGEAERFYAEALRIFGTRKPVVAVMQGAAIGGGLGLGLACDFRVGSPESRFSANFAQLGFHHGFGLTVTLPAVVGQQQALELLYTGRRIGGDTAFAIGLCDRLVPSDELRSEAQALALEIASSAPLAVQAIRATMRAPLVERVRAALEVEKAEQGRLTGTADFAEGLRAAADRRRPDFTGR